MAGGGKSGRRFVDPAGKSIDEKNRVPFSDRKYFSDGWLVGHVTGMIFAFQQVATTRGAAGAGDLAEGIYQALVTTVGGLVVAIPSLAIYAVCRNRVDSMIAEIAYQSQVALAPIKRRPTHHTS